MEKLRAKYKQVLCIGFASGIALVAVTVSTNAFKIGDLVLASADPIPVFFLISSLFGAVISCLRFGYEVVEQSVSEHAEMIESAARMQNPWTAPQEERRQRRLRSRD
jgi:hypothetical protein